MKFPQLFTLDPCSQVNTRLTGTVEMRRHNHLRSCQRFRLDKPRTTAITHNKAVITTRSPPRDAIRVGKGQQHTRHRQVRLICRK